MKRGLWVAVAAAVILLAAGRDVQAFWGVEKKAPAKAVVKEAAVVEDSVPAADEIKEVKAPAAAPAPTAAQLDKQRALRDKKKSMINNSQWDVEITPLSGKGAKQSDVLAFKDNKFYAVNFAKMGFAPSNYTLTVLDDSSIVVETMQSSDKEGIIFWRVEMDKDAALCKGILSRQLSGNKTEDYSFISTGRKPLTAETMLPVAAAETAPAGVKAEPKAEAKKK